MHDTNHARQKDDGVFRILLMGDSFTEALQVAEKQTAHQRLEDLLNQRLSHSELSFQVLNMGVSGWGTGQQLLYYRTQARQYQPDLVIVMFFIGNDPVDNLPGNALTIDGFNCFAPYFSMCDGRLDPEPWRYIPGLDPAWGNCSTPKKWLTTSLHKIRVRSYLIAHLEPLLLSLKPRRIFGEQYHLRYVALYLPQESEEVDYAWQLSEGLLTQFDQEVRADEAAFGVAFFGTRELVWLSQFDQNQLDALAKTDPYLLRAEIDRPNRRLTTFLKNQGVPALDLQPIIIDHIANTGAELYWPFDRHWTAAGNEVVAEALFIWLVDNGLVPQGEINHPARR